MTPYIKNNKYQQQWEGKKNYIWNSQLSVAVDDSLQRGSTVVTIATQVEAKRPIRWHQRQTNHGRVLLNDVIGFWAEKYIHVQHATNRANSESRHWLELHLYTAETFPHFKHVPYGPGVALCQKKSKNKGAVQTGINKVKKNCEIVCPVKQR